MTCRAKSCRPIPRITDCKQRSLIGRTTDNAHVIFNNVANTSLSRIENIQSCKSDEVKARLSCPRPRSPKGIAPRASRLRA